MKIFSFFKNGSPQSLFLFALICMHVPLLAGLRTNTGIFALGSLIAGVLLIRLFYKHPWGDILPIVLNKKFVWLVFGFTSAGWLVLTILKYYTLEYYLWDVGIFSNNIINLIENGTYYNSILNMHGFADHFSPNLILLTPLFQIIPTVMWLTVLKTVAFLITTWFLYQLGITLLGKTSQWIYLAPLLWLTNKYFAYALRVEFHPSSLAPPFIVAVFWFASQKKYVSMLLCLIALLGFKEHLSLIWICMGGFLLGEKQFKLGGVCIGIGLIAGILTYFVIMPSFFHGVGESLHHQSRFGIFDKIPQKISLFTLCLLSVGFIPLVQWKNWLMLIPAFGLTWVTNDPPMLQLTWYYYDISMTVVVVSVVYGIKKMQEGLHIPKLPSPVIPILRIGVVLSILSVNTYYPTQWIVRHLPTQTHLEIVDEIHRYRKNIPIDKELWLDDQIGIQFIQFSQIKNLPMGPAKSYQFLLETTNSHHVVFLKDEKLSNLSRGLHPLLVADLEKLTMQGCYQKPPGFRHLLIYESTDQCL